MVTETFKLINTIKKMYPVQQFFKNRYFPDGKVYYSEKALIECKDKGRPVAPFVIPVVGGIVMDSEGYRAYEVDAPYIAPKKTITAEELSKKAFGESPESGRTPAERENELQAEHMDDLRKAVFRRQELMSAEIITKGEVIMRHYASADDAAKGVNAQEKTLRYFEGSFKNKYTFESDFTKMTAREKLLALYKMAAILRTRGIRATDLVMTSDVSMLLMTDRDFLDYYDNRRVLTGTIDQRELPDGVVNNGNININGVTMTLFTYDDQYEDLDGRIKEFLPKGTIAFLHPNIGETVYAQVTFAKGTSFHSYAERIVPRLVVDEQNNLMEVQVMSRPVPYPYDWSSWLVANIYDNVGSSGTGNGAGAGTGNSTGNGTGLEDTELLTEEEINAMTKKADVIEYGESIGMTGLSDSSTLAELKAAVIEYQNSL